METSVEDAAKAKRDSTAKEEDVVEEKDGNWQRFTKSFNSTTKAFKQMLKKDDDYFRTLFKHIPASEKLLDDFSCALQREILVHGRLYVSQSFLCFYSNIFGWETMLTLPCSDIIAIRKEKVAFVIPNAIEVCTKEANHFFASFAQRDNAFRCLHAVWQNAQLAVPLSPERLLDAHTKEWTLKAEAADTSLRRSVSGASVLAPLLVAEGAEGDAAETSSMVSDSSFASASLPPGTFTTPDAAASTVPQSAASTAGASTAPATASATPAAVTRRASEEAFDCACTDHFGRVVLDKDVPCSVETVCALLFADSKCFRDIYAEQKSTDLVIGAWALGPAGSRPKRELTYVLSLNYSIGPKSAKAIEIQTEIANEPNRRRVIDAEVSTPGVPYGDNFYTVSRYCITRRSAATAHMRISTEVRYRKGAPWAVTKSIIERNTYEGVTNYMGRVHQAVVKASQDVTNVSAAVPALIASVPASSPDTEPELDDEQIKTPTALPGPIAGVAHVPSEPPALGATNSTRNLLILIVALLLVNLFVLLRVWSAQSSAALPQAAPAEAWTDACRAACDSNTLADTNSALTRQARIVAAAVERLRDLLPKTD